MVESILRRLMDHPQRKWIVITITCLVALVATWPAVDYYTAAKTRREELAQNLETIRATTAQLKQFESNVQRQLKNVAGFESRVMTEERVQQFRSEMVQLARACNCRMRRIRVGEPREREWYKEDNPLALRPVSEKAEQTPFVLRTRQFNVSVTGPMTGITQLLTELGNKTYLMHSSGFILQKSDEDPNTVVLELEMLLIELAKPERKKASA